MTPRCGPRSAGAAAALVLLAGCTSQPAPRRDPAPPVGRLQLVAFDSCDEALAGLRAAAKASVSEIEEVVPADAARPGTRDDRRAVGAPAAGAAAPGYSGTNTHEPGADEPDLIKTDGRRIVTVGSGTLRVIDPATRRVTGELDLAQGAGDPYRFGAANLLLHGDRALVLMGGATGVTPVLPRPAGSRPAPGEPGGPRLLLVDLTGKPTLVGTYRIDAALLDARQSGATVRVVVRSALRLDVPDDDRATPGKRAEAERRAIDQAPIDAWLPGYQVSSGGRTTNGRVGCERLSRPATYSGRSVVTLLSFDLGATTLGDGDPVSVAADGETVYSNGERLYLANDPGWWGRRPFGAVGPGQPDGGPAGEPATEIYQFDVAGAGRPRYVTSAQVPGHLINQYALSEWDGHLRVATTSDETGGDAAATSSAVYVLRAAGGRLTETGRVTGLGRGERIYAVRFLGATGYVVTFRQTDPLYTLDLRDPAAPRLVGELKVNGYSAYLHPAAEGRLIGIGQEADARGRTQGTQVSLFDVRDPAKPARLAQYHVPGDHSEAEHDPHAFLYWPADRLLVVPVSGMTTFAGRPGSAKPAAVEPAARVLRVDDRGFTEVGVIDHAEGVTGTGGPGGGGIRRSLVVDGVLWTLSAAGLKATSVAGMRTLSWLAMT
ncbi:beta-propeller domain-containing protein [Micromonospora sp. NPDC049559]|uniref:beta-propeller domain-containing protein n=1 Tax=Micromonospora sp. NPDC049559 TaxID=3155923 RepID=UPI00342340CF